MPHHLPRRPARFHRQRHDPLGPAVEAESEDEAVARLGFPCVRGAEFEREGRAGGEGDEGGVGAGGWKWGFVVVVVREEMEGERVGEGGWLGEW